MKASYTVAATALLACAAAKPHHGHEAYHQLKAPALEARNANASCACATSYTTFYGEATLIQNIQPNATTVQHTATSHVQVTVQPVPATTASTGSPVEASSSPAAEFYTHAAPSPSTSEVQDYAPHPSPSSITDKSPIEFSSVATHSSPSPLSIAPSLAPSPKPHPNTKPSPKPAHPHPKSANHPKPILGSTGSQWCMTYSPYTSSGDCKPAYSITTDVAAIAAKGFSSIRLYSTDCSGLSTVGSAATSHGLKLILGIFIADTGISEAASQVDEIISWASGDWESVEMVVVGNESIFNGFCSAEELAAFIASSKTKLKAAGYTGPVTTTEPLSILSEHASTLCPVLDAAAANIHPFFNADVTAENAGPFVKRELELLGGICEGLEAWNLETGWPSQGRVNGAACPGVEEQEVAVRSIREAVGGRSVFFSFEDDKWKEEGEFAVEQSWGCSQLFGD